MLRRFVLFTLLFSTALLAQTPTTPSPSAPPVPPKPPDHSQESYVVEKLRTSYRFENDGTGRREIYARIRVQSEAGVEQWGQLVWGYNSANEKIEVPYVRVLKADGSKIAASPDAIQDLSIPLEKEAPVYTDYRQKHVTVPGLRPGEELEYDFVTVTHTALAPGQFWMEHDFAQSGTVLDEQLELDVPKDRALKLKTKPGNDPKITEAKGRSIYTWTSSHIEKDDSDKEKDKDKKKEKPKKEPDPPAVQMTTFASWEQMGHWYAGLEKDRRQPTAEIPRQRVFDAELVEDSDDHAPDVLSRPVSRRQAANQQLERALGLARVERCERLSDLGNGVVLLELDSRGEAIAGEARRHLAQEPERAVCVTSRVQHPGQGQDGIGAAGLELDRPAQRLLVSALDQRVGL